MIQIKPYAQKTHIVPTGDFLPLYFSEKGLSGAPKTGCLPIFYSHDTELQPLKGAFFSSLVFVLGKMEGINNAHLECSDF